MENLIIFSILTVLIIDAGKEVIYESKNHMPTFNYFEIDFNNASIFCTMT